MLDFYPKHSLFKKESTPKKLQTRKTKLSAAVATMIIVGAPGIANAANLTIGGSRSVSEGIGNTAVTFGLTFDNLETRPFSNCTISGTVSAISGDSTATEGTDFTITDTDFTVEYDAGDGGEGGGATKDDISIAIIDDNLSEDTEDFIITATNVTHNCSFYGGFINSDSAIIDILDNDGGEGGEGGTPPTNIPTTGSLSETPGLNEKQLSVATVLDEVCESTPEETESLTKGRAEDELQAACATLETSTTLVRDLDSLSPEKLAAMGTLSLQGMRAQTQNLSKQLRRIRQGLRGIDISGLQLNIDGQQLSGNQLGKLFGAGAGDGELHSKWGTFFGGSIQAGDHDANNESSDFDFDVNSFFAGVDYQINDKIVVGGALGYTSSSADIDGDEGETKLSGISLGLFSSYYYKDIYYIDGIISFGDSDYETERNITIGTSSQVADGDTSGNEISIALNSGYYFRRSNYFVHMYGSLNYIDASIDGFEETSSGSSGVLLDVAEQDLESLTTNLGIELGWTINTAAAVISPQISLDWERQYEDDGRQVSASFIGDPTKTNFSIDTDDIDNSYFNAGLGLSAVFKGGFSTYILYEVDLSRDDLDLYDVSLGARWEF
ncbi:MAG: autotransporter outer membrane beta-barrel domain-containing protein [Cellvibrionaceae bacterium]